LRKREFFFVLRNHNILWLYGIQFSVPKTAKLKICRFFGLDFSSWPERWLIIQNYSFAQIKKRHYAKYMSYYLHYCLIDNGKLVHPCLPVFFRDSLN